MTKHNSPTGYMAIKDWADTDKPREKMIAQGKAVLSNAELLAILIIILVHNHPSGNPTPSPEDIQLTQKVKSAGETLDIQLLDHVIITEKQYTSLCDEGLC